MSLPGNPQLPRDSSSSISAEAGIIAQSTASSWRAGRDSGRSSSFPRSQTLFGNALRETPFRTPVSSNWENAKQSFADGVPKLSLGTRGTRPARQNQTVAQTAF